MKKLILSLILIPFLAQAGEISDKDIESKFLTVVKDAEVENVLGKSSEFNDCREKNKFESKDTDAQRVQKLKDANICFSKHTSGKNVEALKKFADDLKLQNYGLIKSKNVNDITEYLAKKMHKALTGRDKDDKNYNETKWEDQKIVDQKIFIDLYTSQLMKNALFEVSRFCFENLRINGKADTNFADHWTLTDIKQCTNNGKISGCASAADLSNINDSGSPPFFTSSSDMSKKEDIYKDIMSGLTKPQSAMNPKQYEYYFGFCQSALPLLCDQFKAKVAANAAAKPDEVIDGKTKVSVSGGNACLTIDRLQLIRTAMKNTEKVAAQFEEMGADKDKFALQMIKNPKVYQNGKGAGEESLDEISSFSSSDMLDKAEENDLDKLEKKCAQGGSSDCEDFLVVGDQLEKAIHNVEYEMNLKKNIEMEAIKSMKGNIDDLKKYLTENGHFDLLNKIEDKSLDPAALDKALGEIYDARKVAEIENLRLKVGKRQVTEDDALLKDDNLKNARIVGNIKETKEERARLAQVVMFNNIITSQLDLTDKSTGKSVGRNVNAWKKEMQGLKSSDSYDETLFDGVQAEAKTSGSTIEDSSVVGGGIIDAILGKKAEE